MKKEISVKKFGDVVTLQDYAKKNDKKSKKKLSDKGREIILSYGIATLCTIICGSAGTYLAAKKHDNHIDHMKKFCVLTNFLGLKHQEKKIHDQYGDEVFKTELIKNDSDEYLNVYYVDDSGEKHLVKRFYQKK